jgi:signal transduction histidine kinase
VTFRLKTMLGIALIESILLVTLVFSALDFLHDSNEEQLQKRANITSRLFKSAIKDAVLSTDLATLESFVEEITSNPDIIYTRIISNKVILAQGGSASVLKQARHQDKSLAEVTDGIYDVRVEIIVSGITYGVIEMGLSTSTIENMLAKAQRWIGGIAGLEIILVALFSFILGTYLTKQLTKLKTASNEIALFGPGHQIPVYGNDEISDVAHAFNDMSNKLSKALIEQERERKVSTAQVIQTSKLVTLGDMSTSVAHELNQPLNVIRLAAANSRRKISKGTTDPEYLNNKLVRIEEQTARAAAIIDHMRMFGREAQEVPKLIDPRNVVRNALALTGEQLRAAGIDIITELPEECPSVLGHTVQMEQVILNLLSNARDAVAERDGEAKITLRVWEDGESVHISSEDSGGGIPEDVLPRIFEPFFTTKDMTKGSGLGLSVGYGIINDMKGTIVAENTDDGARVTVSMPIAS